MPDTTNNYYTSLARDLREVADRIATLADRDLPTPPGTANLFLSGTYAPSDRYTPMIDAIAALFEVTPKTKVSADDAEYAVDAEIGRLHIKAYTHVPRPADERDRRIAELEAELARRDTAQAGASYVDLDAVFPAAAPARPQPPVNPGEGEAPRAYDQFGVPTGGAQ